MAGWHRPRGPRHADAGRAATRDGGRRPGGHRARRVRGARLGVVRPARRRDCTPTAPHGLLGGLEPPTLHHGRRLLDGRARGVRAPVRRRPHLQEEAAGELGSRPADGRIGSRSGERGGGRAPLAHSLPAPRRCADRRGQGLPGRGHHPSGNPARRYGRRRASRRRALSGPGRRPGTPAPRGARPAHRRRHARGPGVRHRVRQDHPGPRLQRLRGRPASRPAAAERVQRRRFHQRQRTRALSRPRPLRGARGHRHRTRWTGTARLRRTPPPRHPPRRPLQGHPWSPG